MIYQVTIFKEDRSEFVDFEVNCDNQEILEDLMLLLGFCIGDYEIRLIDFLSLSQFRDRVKTIKWSY